MTASVSTPADLINLSLRRIGFKWRVGNAYEGSAAAKVALDVYAQTRDELLRLNDWDFAERNVVATLLKYAPAGGYFPPAAWDPTVNPPLPWLYEYAYNSDVIKVRAVRRAPLFVMDFDPQPNVFTVENDNYFTPARKVVLCNIDSAIIVYTGQVTDLTTWEPDAIEDFASTLGTRLAPALMGLDATKLAASEEAQADNDAHMEEG